MGSDELIRQLREALATYHALGDPCPRPRECPQAELIAKADAHLNREVVYAEATVEFVEDAPGEWYFVANGESVPGLLCRIPVPAHLLHPPVLQGEVVDPNGGGK